MMLAKMKKQSSLHLCLPHVSPLLFYRRFPLLSASLSPPVLQWVFQARVNTTISSVKCRRVPDAQRAEGD